MKPLVILVLLLSLSSTVVFGQIKIGDNPQNIDASSVLELESTNKVLVITRVTNLEMESIVPLRGAVLYNTDTQCLHYFNGTEWINLCDAVSFSLTNDPIVNTRSTISITDNGGTINLEVAPNSIRSENIVDGGINGDDIQDNSIGESKLGADSVSANELRDNSVGSTEIVDGTIRPVDIANAVPNQILITDINGIVAWDDAANLQGAVADEVTITGSGTLTAPLALTEAVTTSISDNSDAIIAENTRAIAAEQANANDITNLQTDKEDVSNKDPNTNLGTSDDAYPTQNAVKTYVDAQVGGVSTDDDITGVSFDGTNLTVDEGTTTFSADLSALEESNDIATLQLDVDNNEAAVDAALILKEDIVNKDGNVLLGNSNDAYPTQNAVKVYVDTEIADIVTSGGSDPINETNTDFAVIAGNLILTDISGTFTVPLTDIDTNTQLTDAEIGDFGYIKTDLDEQNLAQVLAQGNNAGAPIIGLNISLDPTSAATRGYVDANLGGNQDLAGVLGNGTSAGDNQITDLLDPTLPQDAATLAYVEDRITEILGAGGADGVINNVSLNVNSLEFTGTANGGFTGLIDLNTIYALDSEVATAIAASAALDLDTDDQNEIELPDDAAATAGDVLSTNAAGVYSWITPALTDTNDYITTGTLNVESLELTGVGTAGATVNLAPFALETEVANAIAASAALDLDTDDQNEIELPDDAAATAGDVLSTNAAGVYSWITPALTDTNDYITTGTLNVESLELTGVGTAGATVNLAPFALETEVANAIAASAALDLDTDDQNEIELPDDAAATAGDVLSTNAAGVYSWITPALTDTNDYITTGTLNVESLELTGVGTAGATVNLAPFALETEVANAIAASAALDLDTDDQNEIELPDDAAATAGDVLSTNAAGVYSWITPTSGNNLSNTNLTQTGTRTYDLDENDLTFDITNSSLTFIGTNSNVGIGNISPQDRLDVDGQIRARNGFGASNGTSGLPTLGFYNDPDTGIYRGTLVNYLRFSTAGNEALIIDPSQNIGIGPTFATGTTVGARLHVDGDILANGTITPDYVFQTYFEGKSNLKPEYKMNSLLEIEEFTKKHNHLPGVPSADEIEEKGGILLNRATEINLEKIEELFLHTIEQEKKIKELKNSNTKMATEVELLKTQLEEIKKMLLAKEKN